MEYWKRFRPDGRWHKVSYEEALKSVLGSYKDNAEVRSWLDEENVIQCVYAEIRVYEDGRTNGVQLPPIVGKE